MKSSLHERRIEINDVTTDGIQFMCHDGDYNSCHCVFTAQDARWLAHELLEAADDLDALNGQKPQERLYVLVKAESEVDIEDPDYGF